MPGFCELAIDLRAPKLAAAGPKSPIVSGRYLKYSRFWETTAGDWVRSTLRGGGAHPLSHQITNLSVSPKRQFRSETRPEFCGGVGMDLVVSSTLALDATHDVECYAAASGRAQFCTSLLWLRKKAEAARARWPSDLQSRRWRTGSASHSSRRIHFGSG